MEEAAKEEAELAILSGNIDSDGTPLITVVADEAGANVRTGQCITHYLAR
jgi:hypothetical protein